MHAGMLHIDRLLTKVSLAFRNAKLIATQVFQEVPVDAQSDKYLVAGKDNLRADDDLRRPGAAANEIDWTLSNAPYYCDGHAQAGPIPDEWRKNNTSGIDLDTALTQTLTDKILLGQEINLVAALLAGATTVDLNATKWDNDANDPIARIEQEKDTSAQKTGQRPNVMVMSRPVFRAVRNNAKVVAKITGASKLSDAKVTVQQLAEALELDELLIGDAVKVTSKEGAAVTSDWVWGKLAALFYRPPAPAQATLAWGYHFMWKNGGWPQPVNRYRIDIRHTDILEVERYYDQRIVCADAGALFINCIA